MKVLVTGSAAFVGRSLTEALLAGGHSVVATYRTSPPRGFVASDRLALVRLDLAQPVRGLEPVDVVIHAAARTLRLPNASASDFVQSNIMTTLNLIDYARATRPKLFVYLSAVSVYGNATVDEAEEETPLSRPELYSASKYVAELIVRGAGGSFPVICVRLPGVVGRGDFQPWIGTALHAAMRHEPIWIYNPDASFNNIVDLQEITRFIAYLIEHGVGGCELVHLAASEPMRIWDVVALIRSLTGSRSEVLVMDRAVKHSFAISIARLRDRFGFFPSTTREILQRYVMENVPAPSQPVAVLGPGGGFPMSPPVQGPSRSRLAEASQPLSAVALDDAASVLRDPGTKTQAWFCQRLPVRVDQGLLAELKRRAADRDHQNTRLCLHDRPGAAFHDMIILEHPGKYYRPHAHKGKGESYHIIGGSMGIFVFTEEGEVADACVLTTDDTVVYRVGADMYHAVLPLSSPVVYHESKPGPFLGEADCVYPEWAPDGRDAQAAAEFTERLRSVLDANQRG